MESRKLDGWTYLQSRNRDRRREQTFGHQGGKRWWREEMEGQDWQTYSADTVRQISKENLGTAQGTLHALWWPKGKEIWKRGGVCVHTADAFGYTVETNTAL